MCCAAHSAVGVERDFLLSGKYKNKQTFKKILRKILGPMMDEISREFPTLRTSFFIQFMTVKCSGMHLGWRDKKYYRISAGKPILKDTWKPENETGDKRR